MSNRKARRVTARYKWDRLRVSFWFAPAVMSVLAILFAGFMYWLDARIPNELLADSHLVLSGTTGQLSNSLLVMATTILTTAGIVFTLLTLPLSTVASQYGSRLLRVFLGDRTTQLVLGMFVATFIYCLAAMVNMPTAELEVEGPQLTATFGLWLLLGSFASLIVLVQHISTMLQAPNIAAAAGSELRATVLAELPQAIRSRVSAGDQECMEPLNDAEAYPVRIKKTGYIEFIDPDTVVAPAMEHDLVIRLLSKPGRFVARDQVVALVWPAGKVDEALAEQICNTFRIGNTRTPTQDVVYGINQLTEMAVRAMSPAINDPFTAMTCLDYIAESLALFVQQGRRETCHYDEAGKLRLVLEPVNLDELLSAAFDMLRHASKDNVALLLHMLEVIERISRAADAPEVRQKLRAQVELILLESRAGGLIEPDRVLIEQRAERLFPTGSPPPSP